MKATELMIGDWVMVYPWDETPWKPKKITDINFHSWEGTNFCDSVGVEGWDELSLDQINPIHITPEILEKNGFIRDPLWHHCDKDLDNYSISVQLGYANRIEYIKIAEKGKDNVIPSERTKLYLTHIKYVHQLQHALRLCGIEKEIVL